MTMLDTLNLQEDTRTIEEDNRGFIHFTELIGIPKSDGCERLYKLVLRLLKDSSCCVTDLHSKIVSLLAASR